MGGRSTSSGLTSSKGAPGAGGPSAASSDTGTAETSVRDLQTRQEIAAYMFDKYKILVDTETMGGISDKALREACDGVELILKAFPKAAHVFTIIKGTMHHKKAIAEATFTGEIHINPKFYGSRTTLDETARRGENSKWHPPGSGKFFTSHEAGHILNLALIKQVVAAQVAAETAAGRRPTAGDIWRREAWDWSKRTTARAIVGRAVKAVQRDFGRTGNGKRVLVAAVSGYAKKNDSETIAECVADYAANGKLAAPLSRAVWQELQKELG